MKQRVLFAAAALLLSVALSGRAADASSGPLPLPQGIETILDQILANAKLDGKYVAVVPLVSLGLDAKSGCRTLLGQYIAERVETRLIMRGGQTVERSRLDAALEELDLNRRTTFDRESAMRLGKLVGAHLILTGSLTELVNSIEVDARLFGTETGTSAGAGYVTLVKDQDILQLLRKGEAGCIGTGVAAEQATEAGSKPAQTDTMNGVRFDLLECQIVSTRITCSATITQSREGYNHVVGGVDGSFLWDQSGKQYPISRIRFGSQEASGRVMVDLPAGVPTRLEVVFDEVPSDLRAIGALVIATYQNKFTFRNIELSR